MRGDRLGGFRGRGYRQADAQHGSGPVAAVMRLDMPALRLDKAAADRQPQPGTGAAAVLGVDAVKFVEDAFEIARRDARALVDDLYDYVSVLSPRANIDGAVGRCVFGRVV